LAEIPDKIKKRIIKFLEELESNNIPIKEAVLFGSYSKGNFHKWSDIDIALVSDIFQGIRMIDRKRIREIKLNVSSDIEVIPFRPQDFTKDNPLVKEILETGMRIDQIAIQ